MGWALAKQCIYCDPHFTVEETETFGQEETVSLRLEALLLKAPATQPSWALTFWGELVKVGLPQEVLLHAGATAYFLKSNPRA